ncbi:hypothetical protein GCM10023196_020730 [Actinoallomurus vinaceus]|uniref:Uncharacterized protein n=1 Tax=Actinoallomurus vinaceus TaxID=1080074 RepID=A0ABP8U7Z9_9ACTN
MGVGVFGVDAQVAAGQRGGGGVGARPVAAAGLSHGFRMSAQLHQVAARPVDVEGGFRGQHAKSFVEGRGVRGTVSSQAGAGTASPSTSRSRRRTRFTIQYVAINTTVSRDAKAYDQ